MEFPSSRGKTQDEEKLVSKFFKDDEGEKSSKVMVGKKIGRAARTES